MHNQEDQIEKLFSEKFEKYEVKSSEQEWLDISSKLNRVNFLKFSFVSFNIYYLAVIIAFAGTTTFTGIKNVELSNKVQRLEFSVRSYQKKEQLNTLPDNYVKPNENREAVPAGKLEKTDKIKDATEDKIKSEIKSKTEIDKDTKQLIDDPKITIPKPESGNQPNFEKKDADVISQPNRKTDSIIIPKTRRVVKHTFVIKPKPIILKDTVVVTKTIK
jgi:hypothetical protein